ncbi:MULTISPECIES: spherulation-specific family 4 protein [Streptomycetaceae]|uniref:Spherulation-specific family 4 n=1 Tax=Streptantibioticus cattleyicolor (strain ATCC 35852 / DSM 46488 / JCM 4925 / NBRC 14057 / NRRL 8057) TaxID=1003195 RepID=F8JUY3_STREN|nr:spherulation-specific family 4 protein [Streptantibioticus cattleyicolor]AEW98145.1 hypothetical protein SCATT_57740 [Streptantibioticus cattleyicolor NRRL 8057 = DSM 46488]MYS62534.1 hypothetical protein [Streptomyces sp. SID5468]CCB78458.1 conserved protein of unknown function [Streptantibioticus cattleyicolor NRRL 8057 = DSM 46488]
MTGRVLVPLYVHPAEDPAAWSALARDPSELYGVVLNVADGPGAVRDRAYVAAACLLRAAGVPVLGYVDVAYGRRPVRAVVADVCRHRAWYRVDGVFLDQAPAGAGLVRRCRRLVRAARALGAGRVVLNHGVHPDPGYAAVADLLVTFEGPWEVYRRAATPGWARDHRAGRLGHLVYGVPEQAAPLVARTAAERGAVVHCAVPGAGANPWCSPPTAYLTGRRPG